MPTWAAQAIAQLAVAVLQYFMGRNDVKAKAKHEVTDELEKLYVKGLEWRVRIGGDPSSAAKLQSLGQHITISSIDGANSQSGTSLPSVSGGGGV